MALLKRNPTIVNNPIRTPQLKSNSRLQLQRCLGVLQEQPSKRPANKVWKLDLAQVLTGARHQIRALALDGGAELTDEQLIDVIDQAFDSATIRLHKHMDFQDALEERTPDRRDARVFAKARIKAWLRTCEERSATSAVDSHEQDSLASETGKRSWGKRAAQRFKDLASRLSPERDTL